MFLTGCLPVEEGGDPVEQVIAADSDHIGMPGSGDFDDLGGAGEGLA